MKLEAGKTYVFKDDAARDEFLKTDRFNRAVFKDYYDSGFRIVEVDVDGDGYVFSENHKDFRHVIYNSEVYLFKEKESKPFDISEYEFSDSCIAGVECLDGVIEIHNDSGSFNYYNKQDAEAMAKHFKLI